MKETISKREIIIALAVAVIIATALTFFLSPSAAFLNNSLWVNVSFMGDAIFAFGVAFFILFILDLKELSLRLMLSIAITLIIVQFTKNLLSDQAVHLYFEPLRVDENSFYPKLISSHTAVAFTLAAFFAYYFKKTGLRIVLFACAIAVAVSRMFIGDENVFSLATGLVPAIVSVLLISRMSLRKPRTKIYRRKERRIQHTSNLMPY